MTALPFSNTSPPIAGNSAKASGIECQCEGSCPVSTSGLVALGKKRLSVVLLIDCPAPLTESEKLEVRELVRRRLDSEKVDARFKPRCRSGELFERAVDRAELASWGAMGGLIVRSRSTYAMAR